MHSALLPNGHLISAQEYTPDIHGYQIFCMDPLCKVPVIFVQETENITAHFKTSGKGESIHKSDCAFFQTLSFQDALSKVTQFQQEFKGKGIKEQVVRLNLNSIDPDYTPRTVERESSDKKDKKEQEIKIKKESPPQTISSLKAVKKLLTSYEPDILASILISVKGVKVPLSYLIRDYQEAHRALWADELNQKLPYFVHGTIDRVIRREKVWYINFSAVNQCFFSLVVFERHFPHFTYKDADLIGKDILAYGILKKNTFSKDKQSTEMQIKSNAYMQFL